MSGIHFYLRTSEFDPFYIIINYIPYIVVVNKLNLQVAENVLCFSNITLDIDVYKMIKNKLYQINHCYFNMNRNYSILK